MYETIFILVRTNNVLMKHRFSKLILNYFINFDFQNIKCKTDEEKLQKDSFLYRAYIALNKHSVPQSEIASNSPPALLAVRRFADYLSNPENKYNFLTSIIS